MRQSNNTPTAGVCGAAAALLLSAAASAQCPLSFNSPFTVTSGTTTNSVAVGDFNADGKLDVVAANLSAGSFSLLLGDGAGGLNPATTFPMGASPFSIAVGDFNGDGKLDVVTASSTANTVTVRLGNGAGGFGGAATFAGGASPRRVVVGDLNGDGKPDLTVSDNSGGMTVLLGNGGGGFGAPTLFAAAVACWSHALGDLNGDGKLDAVLTQSPNRVWVLLGDGAGGFGPPTLFPTGSTPYAVTMGDFNGDGKLDVATANVGGGDISVLMGNGLGGLAAPVSYPAGSNLVSINAADLNGDGRLDLIGVNSYPVTGALSVLLGLPDGTFESATSISTGPTPNEAAVADVNGDGVMDLITANAAAPGTVSVVRQRLAEPRFVAQPQSVSVASGAPATFSVNIASALFPSYQWRRNGVNLVDGGAVAGATSPTLTINPTTPADNGAAYDCLAFNSVGISVSAPAGLAVTTPVTIANDNCASAQLITNGTYSYSTAGATTDGPLESNLPWYPGDPLVNNDVWFLYTATCSGTVTVSLCGSNFDTKYAVYSGATCPTGPDTAIAGGDDSGMCPATVNSYGTFPSTAGHQYLIRVGNWAGSGPGAAIMTISCDGSACLAADMGVQGGIPGRDNQLDNNDFIAFIDAFFNHTGCP